MSEKKEKKEPVKKWYVISAPDEMHDRHGAELHVSVGAGEDASPNAERAADRFVVLRGEKSKPRELFEDQAASLEHAGFDVKESKPPKAEKPEAEVEEPKKRASR